MTAKFAAVDALTAFLRAAPTAPSSSESTVEKIGTALAGFGTAGLAMAEVLDHTGLSRGEFVGALIDGTNSGIFERTEDGRIRLTEQGKAIF